MSKTGMQVTSVTEEQTEVLVSFKSMGEHPCKLTIKRYSEGRGDVYLQWDHEPKFVVHRLPIEAMREILTFVDNMDARNGDLATTRLSLKEPKSR